MKKVFDLVRLLLQAASLHRSVLYCVYLLFLQIIIIHMRCVHCIVDISLLLIRFSHNLQTLSLSDFCSKLPLENKTYVFCLRVIRSCSKHMTHDMYQ